MVRLGIFLPGLFLLASRSFAQDLDPRAYMRLPLKTTTAFTGFAYSRGGVVTDPTLSLKKYSGRRSVDFIWCFPSIQFFGLTSQALLVTPYSWVQVAGDVLQQAARTPVPVLQICWSFRSEVAMFQPIQEKCLLDFMLVFGFLPT